MEPGEDSLRRMAQIDAQIQAFETLADDGARQAARALVQAVLEFHALGLARMLEIVGQAGAAGLAIRETCAQDAVVGALLTLHGLHPVDVGARLAQVLEQLRPLLDAHGASATVLSVAGGTVRISLSGPAGDGRHGEHVVRLALETALLEKVPDLARVEFAGHEPAGARFALPVIPMLR